MKDVTDEVMGDARERKAWPAVDAAFAFVIPSYQMIAGRFEAEDSRITSLLSLMSTLTLAAPIFAKNVRPNISFESLYFALGMFAFLFGAVTGMFGRLTGRLTLVNPSVLYTKTLSHSEWEFKKNQIYFAGEHFEANAAVIDRKRRFAICVTVAFLFQVVAFVAWIAR